MKAMILAAGLGTRMEELTISTPKPMLPVLGVPLISHTLFLLHRQRCQFAAINTHYLADQIFDYLSDFPYFPLQFTREEAILGTGGGISNALQRTDLSGFFWVLNPDCIYLPEFSLQRIDSQQEAHLIANQEAENQSLDSYSDASASARASSVQNTSEQPLDGPAPILTVTSRTADSLETGFSFSKNQVPKAADRPHTLHFDSQGNYLYTGMALLHDSQFRDIPMDSEYNIVEDWKVRAQAGGLLGLPYAGRILDLGRKKEYLEIHKERNAFPLTYIRDLEDFMLQWKGSPGTQ
ncbi:MAG: hypothetical protein CMF59_18485 [Leptospiraceae bacterium]|nr:hypothetical protein [Leptospiraceae bacterium]